MFRHLILATTIAVTLSGCAQMTAGSRPHTDTGTPDISTFLHPENARPDGMSDIRYQLLNETGKTLGFRGGRAERAAELRRTLEHRATTLDALYDFRPLLSPEGWLPPVIDEARDVAHVTGEQFRTADTVWTIVSPERFVSNPPGWRTWLFTGLSDKVTPPDGSVIPEDRSQRKVWEQAVRTGWQEGRDAADQILEANFNRLNRDYRGMMLYAMLRSRGMISAPAVSDTVQSVTGSTTKLVTGDRVRRLKQHAGFELNKTHWRPPISTEKP
ncbi:TPA: type IV secretory system conjugative DNA transfer family protein [Escherichia coli]|nr:type IV secretory system conjugative DNA transfer family protein [Escherichia coli]